MDDALEDRPAPPVLVETLSTLDFRNLANETTRLGPGLTVLFGPNGAGKTNILEAIYFALTGRSCRTNNEREMAAFGKGLARAEAEIGRGSERQRLLAAFSPTEGRRHTLDGIELRSTESERRPTVAVFMPDRLALIKGPPAARRGHLDRLVAALWPARADCRQAYGRALAQRNALLSRIRAGHASSDSLEAWDQSLAESGARLIAGRSEACDLLAAPFSDLCAQLQLPGPAALRYRGRCEGSSAAEIVAELASRHDRDLEAGRTTHGPHLDEVVLSLEGHSLRRYGSQGQQRAALLALLFAERSLLQELRGSPPLMLLDDVMSELDPGRRELLVEHLGSGGQALITATHLGQLPDGERAELQVANGKASPPAGPSIRAVA